MSSVARSRAAWILRTSTSLVQSSWPSDLQSTQLTMRKPDESGRILTPPLGMRASIGFVRLGGAMGPLFRGTAYPPPTRSTTDWDLPGFEAKAQASSMVNPRG